MEMMMKMRCVQQCLASLFCSRFHSQWILKLQPVKLCYFHPRPTLQLFFPLITLFTSHVKQKDSPPAPNQVNITAHTHTHTVMSASPAHESKEEKDEQMDAHPPPPTTCLASSSSHSTDAASPADIFSPSKVLLT